MQCKLQSQPVGPRHKCRVCNTALHAICGTHPEQDRAGHPDESVYVCKPCAASAAEGAPVAGSGPAAAPAAAQASASALPQPALPLEEIFRRLHAVQGMPATLADEIDWPATKAANPHGLRELLDGKGDEIAKPHGAFFVFKSVEITNDVASAAAADKDGAVLVNPVCEWQWKHGGDAGSFFKSKDFTCASVTPDSPWLSHHSHNQFRVDCYQGPDKREYFNVACAKTKAEIERIEKGAVLDSRTGTVMLISFLPCGDGAYLRAICGVQGAGGRFPHTDGTSSNITAGAVFLKAMGRPEKTEMNQGKICQMSFTMEGVHALVMATAVQCAKIARVAVEADALAKAFAGEDSTDEIIAVLGEDCLKKTQHMSDLRQMRANVREDIGALDKGGGTTADEIVALANAEFVRVCDNHEILPVSEAVTEIRDRISVALDHWTSALEEEEPEVSKILSGPNHAINFYYTETKKDKKKKTPVVAGSTEQPEPAASYTKHKRYKTFKVAHTLHIFRGLVASLDASALPAVHKQLAGVATGSNVDMFVRLCAGHEFPSWYSELPIPGALHLFMRTMDQVNKHWSIYAAVKTDKEEVIKAFKAAGATLKFVKDPQSKDGRTKGKVSTKSGAVLTKLAGDSHHLRIFEDEDLNDMSEFLFLAPLVVKCLCTARGAEKRYNRQLTGADGLYAIAADLAQAFRVVSSALVDDKINQVPSVAQMMVNLVSHFAAGKNVTLALEENIEGMIQLFKKRAKHATGSWAGSQSYQAMKAVWRLILFEAHNPGALKQRRQKIQQHHEESAASARQKVNRALQLLSKIMLTFRHQLAADVTAICNQIQPTGDVLPESFAGLDAPKQALFAEADEILCRGNPYTRPWLGPWTNPVRPLEEPAVLEERNGEHPMRPAKRKQRTHNSLREVPVGEVPVGAPVQDAGQRQRYQMKARSYHNRPPVNAELVWELILDIIADHTGNEGWDGGGYVGGREHESEGAMDANGVRAAVNFADRTVCDVGFGHGQILFFCAIYGVKCFGWEVVEERRAKAEEIRATYFPMLDPAALRAGDQDASHYDFGDEKLTVFVANTRVQYPTSALTVAMFTTLSVGSYVISQRQLSIGGGAGFTSGAGPRRSARVTTDATPLASEIRNGKLFKEHPPLEHSETAARARWTTELRLFLTDVLAPPATPPAPPLLRRWGPTAKSGR